MVSIIRSPAISDEKRKLSTRSPQAKEEPPAVAPPIGTAAKSSPVPHAGPPPNFSPNPAPKSIPTPAAPDVDALMEQARLSVMAQLKDEAEAARDAGRQQGLREGRLAGTEEVKQSFAAELARVKTIADSLQQAMESGIQGMEEMAVAIAYEAVCKVMGNAAVTCDGVQALVRQAASQVLHAGKMTVRLHAADLSMLREAGALETTLPAGMTVSWTADKNVALGGCVIETDGGELDARLETQMERLRAALVTARAGAAASNPETSPERKQAVRHNDESSQ